MLFIYLAIISIIGITIIVLVERKKSNRSLLQILKKLCSIDSIRFEKELEKAHRYSLKSRIKMNSFWKINFSKMLSYTTLKGGRIRCFIRKKLHPETETLETSRYIKDIKGEI